MVSRDAGRHRQGAAFRHGLQGIQPHVEKDLRKLVCSRDNAWRMGSKFHSNLAVPGSFVEPHDIEGVGHERVGIACGRFQAGRPGEAGNAVDDV